MADTYKYWKTRLEKEKAAHKKFREQAKIAAEAARDDGDKKHAFNIVWSSSKVIRSAVYASRPKPDVRRRYQKPNPEEKELARLVERAIEYHVDSNDFESPSQAVVKDFIESGIGIPRVVYDVDTQPVTDDMGQPVVDEMGEPMEEVVAQTVGIEHIPWAHFHWEPGKSWNAVDWIAFRAFKPAKEVEEEYGIKISGGKDDETKRDAEEYTDEVELVEIWHKVSGKVYVLATCYPEILDEYDDPLQLQGFFPIPRPLFANLKSDELIPKPDYEFIRPQVVELNRLTQRINSLAKQIKAVGYYDAGNKEFSALMASPDGTYMPISGLNTSLEHSKEALVSVPMLEKIQVIRELEAQREQVKGQIFEVSGISDIIRGDTKATETATAQQIKGQYAQVRLRDKQADVARVWRDTFRMFAEIICEHFQPQVLQLQTGIEVTPTMYQIMKSDIGRSFAIDVETDSTVMQDDYENRQQTMEMVDTVLQRMETVIPAVQSGALPVEFVQEVLLMVVSTHKHGKQLEDAIMSLAPHLQGLQQFQQQMQQMQQQLMQTTQQRDQAAQAAQAAQAELQKVNQRKEAREDAKVQAEIGDKQTDNAVAQSEAQASNQLKKAQTAKIYSEIMQPRIM